MNAKPKEAYCACLRLERVVEHVGDHNVETNRWRCSACGKEREFGKKKEAESLYGIHKLVYGVLRSVDGLTKKNLEELLAIFDFFGIEMIDGMLRKKDYSVEATQTGRLPSNQPNVSNAPKETINWPNPPEGAEVLYTIQTTEEHRVKEFLNIRQVHMLIWDFENWLRQQWKYNEEGYTDDQHKTLTEIRDKWYELKEELEVNID